MALVAVYKQFLAAPNPSQLSPEAALHYITTTTSFRGRNEVMKHLSGLVKQLKKKNEDFLSVIEGQNAIAVEVDTVLEFLSAGGPYLPGLDDNFLTDRTVYLPIMHLVTFDKGGKILQIRQTWDQGSLLKQIDVIGKSGRNWPIRDSKEQIKLIEIAVKSSVDAAPDQGSADFTARSRGNSSNVLRDPHASLALFAPREESDESIASVISPKGGARPRQRDFAEILGDEPIETLGRERSESPSKAVAPKAGAEKKFQPSRLFEDEVEEEDDSLDAVASPSRFIRPNPKKYSHFDFVDGPDESHDVPQSDATSKRTKHSSQWSFDDFNTPHKAKPSKTLAQSHQDVRHWSTEDDEVQESPERKPVPVKPRRDAEPHFEFVDDGPSVEPRVSRPRGATHNNGLGLYKNNVYSEGGEETAPLEESKPLGAITNLKDRDRDFEAHWNMTDESPAQKPQSKPPVGENRKKAVKMMDANWSTYDQSPVQKENKPIAVRKADGERGIHIGGDGMGGGKGSNRNWLFGEEDDVQTPKPARKERPATTKSGGFNWDF
ncbi:hypothetical protein GGR53DRAFT_192804 [Hypoxylon sp. FL1150]|nr:hypothetical protein GGR53DRAFT_192804 [Hypoxylon sp. FL1150]